MGMSPEPENALNATLLVDWSMEDAALRVIKKLQVAGVARA